MSRAPLVFEPVPHGRGALFEHWVSGMVRMEMPVKKHGAPWHYAWDSGPSDKGRLTILGLATGHRADRNSPRIVRLRAYALGNQGSEMSTAVATDIYDLFWSEHFKPALKKVGTPFATCLLASSTFLGGIFVNAVKKHARTFGRSKEVVSPWPRVLSDIERAGLAKEFVTYLCEVGPKEPPLQRSGWANRYQRNAVHALRAIMPVSEIGGISVPNDWFTSPPRVIVVKRSTESVVTTRSRPALQEKGRARSKGEPYLFEGPLSTLLEAFGGDKV